MYQIPLVSKHIPLYLFALHSPLILSVEYHGLEFLDAIYSSSLEITGHNREQHIKDYSG